MNTRIVITGIGPVTSLGIGRDQVWERLCQPVVAPHTLLQQVGDEEWDSFPLSEVEKADLEKSKAFWNDVEKNDQPCNRDLVLFALAGRLAMIDSGLDFKVPRVRCGIVISHENPGVDNYTREIWNCLAASRDIHGSPLEQIKKLYLKVESAGYATHSFVSLQQLTKLLKLHGPALVVNNACASGLFALEAAANWLRSGHCDTMIVICGDSPRLLTRYLWLRAAQACSPDGVMRPFDKNRSGFVLGEGAGAIVLETLDSARKRGVRQYTEYVAGSFKSDAWRLSLPSVSPHFYFQAIKEVLERASAKPEEIDLLVPHGAASPLHDRYEADGITAVFGKHPDRPLITALKPYIGHTLAGSSLIELILTLIGLSKETVIPTPNWTTPDNKLALTPVTKVINSPIGKWIKSATGFGGFNAACVFDQTGVYQ